MWKISLVMGLTAAFVMAQDETPDKRLRHTESVLQSINTQKGISHDLFSKARCVIVVPGLKKGAFVFGGDYGRGYAMCRKGDMWGGPAAIRIGGGSFGAQLGLESTDVLMLVMNQRGMDRLAGDKFTIGVDGSAAIGPIGRDLRAGTDATLRAEILTYARSKGAFAGVSLDGTTVTPDRSEDRKLYGEKVKNGAIIRGEVAPPSAASSLIAELNSLSGQTAPTSEVAQVNPPAQTVSPAPVEPSTSVEPQNSSVKSQTATVQSQPQTSDQPSPANDTLAQTQNQQSANLPQTASPYPLFGLVGLGLIGLYAALRIKVLS